MPVILTIDEPASESMSMTVQPASAGFCSLRPRLQSGALRGPRLVNQPTLAGLLRLA